MRSRWREGLLALLAAVAFVLAVDAWTGETAPIWDGKHYLAMARHGYEKRLVAPFAYRPGMPFLARWIAGASGLEVESSFKLVGRAAATLILLCAYGGARSLGACVRSAAFIALAVGLTNQHVRLPLFFWSLVDVSAFALVLLASWWAWKGWTLRAGVVATAGLLFKEMLLVPWAVGLIEGAVLARRERWRWRWLALFAIAAAGLACFLVPRLVLQIDLSRQWIDPVRPETLARIWEAPASFERWSTIVAASLSYWLPTLLLLTRDRAVAAWPELLPRARGLVLYLGLLFPLVLYGGGNIPVFVCYSVPVQVLVLAILTRVGRVETWELALVLACLSVFQRLFTAIPDPTTELDAYAIFNGLGKPRDDARHLLEAGGWLGVMLSARLLVDRLRRRGVR